MPVVSVSTTPEKVLEKLNPPAASGGECAPYLPFTRWLYRPGVFSSMILICALCIGQAWAGERSQPTLQGSRPDFERAFAKNDYSGIKRLAMAHPDRLRPLVDGFLADFSKASAESRPKEARRAYRLAMAVAEVARELFDDPLPADRVKFHRAWARGDHLLKIKADALLKETMAAFDEGRFGDVLAPGRASLETYATLGDTSGEGQALHCLGQAERRLANYAEALVLHQRALELAKKMRDPLLQGQALTDLGDVHEREKDLKTAIAFYREAIHVLNSPAHWQASARAHRQLGDVYVATGKFESAYESYSLALRQAEKANDAERVSEFNDYIGFCHRRLGDYKAASAYHRRALESGDMIASDTPRSRARARSLNHLGLCVSKLAEADAAEEAIEEATEKYREAIAHEEEALGLAARIQDRWRQGYVLRALSVMHLERGALLKNPEAAREFEQSLARAEEALELGVSMQEREWQGLALHNRGLALARLGRQREGLETFNRALELWTQIGDLQSAGYAHRFVARQFHETGGQPAEAEASYDRAILAFDKIADVESQAFTLMDKARVAALQGRRQEAAGLYDAGVAALEAVRARAGFPEFRKAFMGKAYDRYEEAALFALGQNLNDRALRYVESLKARAFLDQLAEGRVELEKGIDPDLKARRENLESALAAATEQIAAAYRKPTPDETELAASKARMESLGMELDQLKKQIRLQNPLYASIQYPEPVTAAELQRKVLRQDEVLLEYFITSRGVFCFVVTTDGFEAVRLAAGAPELRSRVAALLDNLESGPGRGEGYDRAAAGELYDILVKPFEKAMAGKTLVVVPDGILALFPFEALVVLTEKGERSYLFEKHAVKYAPSASVLALLRTQRPAPPAGGRFIGFGDPVYDYDSFRQGKPEGDVSLPGRGVAAGIAKTRHGQLEGRLGRLEGSGEEVLAIERLFPEAGGAKALLRQDAREEHAKAAGMEGYGYIHFSMHGIVTPELQAIAFSQIPDSAEDGLLTMGEVMNLRYNARLVVLSACQTGLGKIERGEGVTGLTRAVIYAGTPAAVVSLWSVDDTATRELMTRFYEAMIQKGAGSPEALRRAKQEVLATHYRHPYFWAAFVMYGE
jgi:CHAT domain-containing protein/predicted negative regulator of RcsB-dependent stress response